MESPTSTHTNMISVRATLLKQTPCDDARVRAMCAYHAALKKALHHKFTGSSGGHSASYLAFLRAREEDLVKSEKQALLRAEKRRNRN